MKRRLGEVLNIPISNSISKYLACPMIQGRVKRSTLIFRGGSQVTRKVGIMESSFPL